MKCSLLCSPKMVSQLWLRGDWPWSPSCNSRDQLSDRQAAHAVRARLDWKYALGLELEDRGFDFSVLSEFRARLIEGQMEYLLFETMLGLPQTTRAHQSRRKTSNRCHTCAGGCACHQPRGLCRRNHACNAQY